MAEERKHPRLELTSDAPRELSVTDLAQSHAKEIRALTMSVQDIHKSHNKAQTVPHYMRRRAASHNINRLPRKIREAIKAKPPPPKPKKHSRYHRRRPKNLMEEYAKRQRRVTWLETHLWHAKRFHMIEKWGHKLAHYPTEKSERSAYRAAINHCLIQDQSYMYCLEVTAPEQLMIPVLKTLTREGQLQKGSVEAYVDGRNVLNCVLYEPYNAKGAICPVEIIYNPRHKANQHHIWIWCHTAGFRSVCDTVCDAFRIPVCEKGSPFSISKSADSSIVIKSLKESFVRYKLHGKQTKEMLSRVIKPVNTNPDAAGEHVWWKGDFASRSGEITQSVKDFLSYIPSTDMVATVRTRDPRLCMASILEHMKELKLKKVKLEDAEHMMTKELLLDNDPIGEAVTAEYPIREDVTAKYPVRENAATEYPMEYELTAEHPIGEDLTAKYPIQRNVTSKRGFELDKKRLEKGSSNGEKEAEWSLPPPYCPLWDEGVREIVSNQMMSQHQINTRRSQLLVPGAELNLGDEESCVPLMLILNKNMADVIMPAKWGMAFWVAFAYTGCRPGGLRENKMVNFETSRLTFPDDFPDTEVCQQQELEEAKELFARHLRYPPAKRPNFDKLHTNSPFSYDWTSLRDVDNPVIVRDLNLLNTLKDANESEGDNGKKPIDVIIPSGLWAVTLVSVSLTMVNRGIPEPRAEICLPLESDIADLKTGKNKYGPVLELYNCKAMTRGPCHSTLPGERLESGREILGYVKQGRFSPRLGHAIGFGFVTVMTFIGGYNDGPTQYSHDDGTRGLLCLVRNVDSRQYRYAVINVNTTNNG